MPKGLGTLVQDLTRGRRLARHFSVCIHRMFLFHPCSDDVDILRATFRQRKITRHWSLPRMLKNLQVARGDLPARFAGGDLRSFHRCA